MDTATLVAELSGEVRKICAPGAPAPLKGMAAAGMAPLPPVDLVSALAVLSVDDAADVAAKAGETLDKLPEKVLLGALDQPLHAGVLDLLAGRLLGRAEPLEKLLLHRSLGDETVLRLTPDLASERLLEIVAGNEERLLRAPEIIEALYFNKHSRMSSVDRAIELAVRNGIVLEGIPAFAEAKAAIEGELIVEPEEEPSPEDRAFSDLIEDEELAELNEELVDETLDAEQDEAEAEESREKEKIKQANAEIGKLTVSQKVRMAMLGNATQRSVLIRDSNKMVILAVLKSPALSDSEVMRYAKARSLPEEAVRYICSKRDWTKHYQVKLNLVQNPRTPLQEALKYLNHLRAHDVRAVERSRDVPQAISRAAKALRTKRGA